MAEYISKQDVLDYLNGYLHSLGYGNTDLIVNGERKALINSIQDISAVKAADVQPVRHGQWLPSEACITIDCQVCSECRSNISMDRFYYDYCPVCGARMNGE